MDDFIAAPMGRFLELILEPVPKKKRDLLVVAELSFHKGYDKLCWLKAKFYLKPFCINEDDLIEDEEDRWICASVIYDPEEYGILFDYCTEDNSSLPSLEAGIDSYYPK